MTLQATEIILRPVISEKSMDQTTRQKYTFAVRETANKLQIKSAVEELFSVTVLSVNERQIVQGQMADQPPSGVTTGKRRFWFGRPGHTANRFNRRTGIQCKVGLTQS